MKKFKQLLLVAIFLLPAAVSAQKYHDAAAFGLNGHVKEITCQKPNRSGELRFVPNYRDPYHVSHVCFDEEGKITKCSFYSLTFEYKSSITDIRRNKDGYITSIYFSNGFHWLLQYDAKKRLQNKWVFGNYDTFSSMIGFAKRYEYGYDAKGRLESVKEYREGQGNNEKPEYISDKNPSPHSNFPIKFYEYDKHNNITMENKTMAQYFRRITYWPNNSSSASPSPTPKVATTPKPATTPAPAPTKQNMTVNQLVMQPMGVLPTNCQQMSPEDIQQYIQKNHPGWQSRIFSGVTRGVTIGKGYNLAWNGVVPIVNCYFNDGGKFNKYTATFGLAAENYTAEQAETFLNNLRTAMTQGGFDLKVNAAQNGWRAVKGDRIISLMKQGRNITLNVWFTDASGNTF